MKKINAPTNLLTKKDVETYTNELITVHGLPIVEVTVTAIGGRLFPCFKYGKELTKEQQQLLEEACYKLKTIGNGKWSKPTFMSDSYPYPVR